jgi:hypothetical protein
MQQNYGDYHDLEYEDPKLKKRPKRKEKEELKKTSEHPSRSIERIDSTVAVQNGVLLMTLGLLIRISVFHKEVGIYFAFCALLWLVYAFMGYMVPFFNTQTNIPVSDGFLTFLSIFRIIIDLVLIAGAIYFFVLIIQF